MNNITSPIRFIYTTVMCAILLTACGSKSPVPAQETPAPVTLNLQWVTQAQFAGYYVALDKGWYSEEGIDLTIRPGGPDISAIDSVRTGTAEFGTSLLADIIVVNQPAHDLVSIAQIQQTNGLLLIAKKDSGITQPRDFVGKRVGVWLGNWEAQFNALMAKEGIGANDFTLVSQGFSMDTFINGELDVASAMIYNEYYTVLESGLKPEDITIINYADYGLDFPGDVLFTSTKIAQENPDLCVRMLRASLRGWQYAIENPEEAANIVLKYDKSGVQTLEHQLSMMREIAKLVQVNLRPIGYSDRADVRRTIDTLYSYKILDTQVNPDSVFTNDFWEQAQPQK
jgi:NitT/TauT family transport system substrate-binding protein